MWRGGQLSSCGVRLLGMLGCASRGTRARLPLATSWSVCSEDQLSRKLQIKLQLFNEYRSMWLRSYGTTFSCLEGIKNYRCPWKRTYSTSGATVDHSEVKFFLTVAHRWWDEEGVFSLLHSMNDLRVPFIRPASQIMAGSGFDKDRQAEPVPYAVATVWFHRYLNKMGPIKLDEDNLLKTVAYYQPGKPLSGMSILDVGCGGGLLTEPLGRLGASVTGIDPVDENIKIAQHHKSFDPALDKNIVYKVCSLEELVEESTETFDAVVASEVVEHVSDVETFIQLCYRVLKPGGSLFITTISKTQLSYLLGIVFTEQIAGIVPKGTHMWEKFVSPEQLESILESNGLSLQTVAGMFYNPFSGRWRWSESTSLNYAAHAVRSTAQEHPAESASKESPSAPARPQS